MNLVVFIMCCAEQCFQIVWLCNILDVAGLPDYLDILNFCIISKHTKINHNPRFGRFWENLHESKKMFVLACQSVTSWDALLKSAATRRLLIASTRLLSRWVSIRHPCRGVTLFEKLGSKSSMGFYSLLWIVLSDQKNERYTWYIFKDIVWLRSNKRVGMCPTENQLAKFLKSWLGDSSIPLEIWCPGWLEYFNDEVLLPQANAANHRSFLDSAANVHC